MECLAHALSEHNAKPDHVIFTTYQERLDGSTRIGESYILYLQLDTKPVMILPDKPLKVPDTPFPDLCAIYSSLWKEIHPHTVISTEPTIEGAIKLAEQISMQYGGMQTFVTGSLRLVGGALNFLRP